MANRTSVSNMRATLTVGDRTFAGFTSYEPGTHKANTGRTTAAGAKGDVVTISGSLTGDAHTMTLRYDKADYADLKRAVGREGTLAVLVVDADGLVVDTLATHTGVVASIVVSKMEAGSGDPMEITVSFEADGEVL